MPILSLTCHLYWQLIPPLRCAALRGPPFEIPPEFSSLLDHFLFLIYSSLSPPYEHQDCRSRFDLLAVRYMESSLGTINTASNATAVVIHLRVVLKTQFVALRLSSCLHHAPSSYTIQDASDMAEVFENLRQIQIKTTNKIINTKLGAISIAPLYNDF